MAPLRRDDKPSDNRDVEQDDEDESDPELGDEFGDEYNDDDKEEEADEVEKTFAPPPTGFLSNRRVWFPCGVLLGSVDRISWAWCSKPGGRM